MEPTKINQSDIQECMYETNEDLYSSSKLKRKIFYTKAFQKKKNFTVNNCIL
jgi:hypothetical protein